MTAYQPIGPEAVLARYWSALAMLPETYRPDGEVPIAVLDGSDPGWPGRLMGLLAGGAGAGGGGGAGAAGGGAGGGGAGDGGADAAGDGAAGGGAAAIVICSPTAALPIPDGPIPDGPIALALPWAGGPAGRQVPPAPPETRLVTVDLDLASPRPWVDAAADALTVLARSTPEPMTLSSWRESARVLSATGRIGAAVLQLTGVRSSAARDTARLAWRSVAYDTVLTLPAAGAAWPGSVTRFETSGATTRTADRSDHLRETLLAAVAIAERKGPSDIALYRRAVAAVLQAGHATP